MFISTSFQEIEQIVYSSHNNPHNILGMHEVTVNHKQKIAVRSFNPFAKKIVCINKDDTSKQYTLIKIHTEGFFQLLIDCSSFFDYYFSIETHDGVVYETHDCYSFLPQISDFDCFLFAKGTHYEIYNKLGAHLKTVDGVSGVSFAVWAPCAKRVSVIGKFNNWDGRVNQMRMIGASGIFEIFIPHLKENQNYKFEIKTQDNKIIEKSDPYSNFNELRPSHSSLVTDLSKYKWKDDTYLKARKNKDILNSPINIYEVHLGSWQKPDSEKREFLSYIEMIDELIPYVKEMGYTHIELMPITEHPFDGSWGYQVTGYYSVTSRYGSPAEFMEFIDACHENDIGVILDWVPAHFPKDAHGLAQFDGSHVYEHADKKQGEHLQWGTLIFNYGRNEVANFLIANALFWLDKYHIDGIRVDAVASMLYLDYCKDSGQWLPNVYGGRENLEAIEFIKHLNSIIEKTHPDVLICAEESTSWPHVSSKVDDGGLGFNLKWNMGWMNDYLSYMEEDPINRKYHHNKLTFAMMYNHTENFILVLSHDEVVHGKKSMLNKMPGDLWQKCANLRLSYGFMYGHPGKILNFMGNEFGQFIEWDEKKQLDWFLIDFPHHKLIQNFVKDLNHLYLKERAFWLQDFDQNGFEWVSCDDKEHSIVIFSRKTDKVEDTLIFVCNFTPNTYEEYFINMPIEGSYKEILNSDSKKYGGSGVTNTITFKTSPFKDKPNVIAIRVAPLSTTILKYTN